MSPSLLALHKWTAHTLWK